MEQHPVPRNISGFQFHLVGDMTLKQFGYLAGGIILAYLIYKFPLPSIISIPLAALVAVSGIAFAFVPIQERPLDRWLVAFIKSIYSPTQYIWHKNNPPLAILTTSIGKPLSTAPKEQNIIHKDAQQKLAAYLSSLPPTLEKTVSQNEKAYLDKTLSLFDILGNQPTASFSSLTQEPINLKEDVKPAEEKLTFRVSPASPPGLTTKPASPKPKTETPKAAPQPVVSEEKKNLEEEVIKKEALKLREELNQQTISKERFLELERKLEQLLTEKESLTSELSKLRKTAESTQRIPVKPVYSEEKKEEPTVKTIGAGSVQDVAGMPSVPTVGNIIIGIVRDNLKRLLPGIIVTVKDPSGMPLRALKTNKLGQFAAATPLANGNYLIEIEDPQKRYQFELIEISLNGNIFMPIEIIAKGSREILRDKLNKEIFGNNPVS